MTTLSTHVLDTATGEPAAGMRVHLSLRGSDGWDRLADKVTDDDGRLSFGDVGGGTHRLAFETGAFGSEFYPFVHIVFQVDPDREHLHVPLLLSPFGYTTYRGS